MYTVFIYNNESHRLERYKLEPYCRMPYSCCNPLYVADFFSDTVSTIGWTSTEFIFKWNKLFGTPNKSPSFFRRAFEGGHISESMHYAGLAADCAHAPLSHAFPFSESNHIALAPAGFPEVKFGDIGIFVLVLQDCLCTLGFCEGELDGFFGNKTQQALSRFCKTHNIDESPVCGQAMWSTLTFRAVGSGFNQNIKYVDRSKIIL